MSSKLGCAAYWERKQSKDHEDYCTRKSADDKPVEGEGFKTAIPIVTKSVTKSVTKTTKDDKLKKTVLQQAKICMRKRHSATEGVRKVIGMSNLTEKEEKGNFPYLRRQYVTITAKSHDSNER